MSLSFRLRLKLPNGRQKSVVLKKDTVSIGRDSSCDVKINDPEISRNHACLTLYSIEDMFIKDMGSSNGTYLRNSPITQKTRIAPGAIIRMGNTYLSIEVSGGFSVETFSLPVSDAEYQKFASIFEPENKSKSSQEQLLLELFDDLIISDAGIQNLELLLNRIAAFLKAENGLILLDSEGAKGKRAVRITRGDKLYIPENIINTIQESGKCIILPSFAMDKNHNQLLNVGTGSAICAPFSKKDSIKGVIYLERST
ncbi:FHA domain-containing protein, partial [bacterium]|nr:FHA domain-containing protein [bacterium]